MVRIELDDVEAAALEVVARHEGITPERLVRDLIRGAAVSLVTGQRKSSQPGITIQPTKRGPATGGGHNERR